MGHCINKRAKKQKDSNGTSKVLWGKVLWDKKDEDELEDEDVGGEDEEDDDDKEKLETGEEVYDEEAALARAIQESRITAARATSGPGKSSSSAACRMVYELQQRLHLPRLLVNLPPPALLLVVNNHPEGQGTSDKRRRTD